MCFQQKNSVLHGKYAVPEGLIDIFDQGPMWCGNRGGVHLSTTHGIPKGGGLQRQTAYVEDRTGPNMWNHASYKFTTMEKFQHLANRRDPKYDFVAKCRARLAWMDDLEKHPDLETIDENEDVLDF